MQKLVVAFASMVVLSMLALPFFGRLQASTSSHTQTNTDSLWMEEQKDISFKSAMPYENHSANSENSGVSPFIIPIPPGGGGGCSGGGGGGGSPPVSISLKIDIFQGQAEIQVGNNYGSNGAIFTLNPYSSYQLTIISINNGYEFFQWETDTGYVDNPESASATLHTGSGSGNLVLALNYTTSIYGHTSPTFWAGFVQSGTTSTVTGEFYVPGTNLVPTGPSPTDNVLDIWIGIGGFSNNNLWQGGIEIDVTPTDTTIQPFYQATSIEDTAQYLSGVQISSGDHIQVWTNYSSSLEQSSFKLIDLTNGQVASKTLLYTPDTSTAEWVVEDPTFAKFTMPSYNAATWVSADSNSGNLISPITLMYQEVYWSGAYQQASYPHYITEPSQFYVSYWGPNG